MKITNLARSVTVRSRESERGNDEVFDNPFEGSDDPRLNPASGKFDFRAWIKSILSVTTRDPESFPHRTAGVSFKNLSVYGYGKPTDFQKTVLNSLLDAPRVAFDSFRGQTGKRIDILRNFEGVLRAGEMLVVLGRPGAGCTTFLKSIAGETHGFYIQDEEAINYQGIPFKMMHKNFRGEVIYNAEVDVHFPNLTVGQTLSFAAAARTPRTRLPGVSREQWADHLRDVVMAVFGLSHTINTKVGNDFIRGVSGGERKRVSIAEVALSGSPLQCWDNSTRGLDSATALEFVKTLRLSTQFTGSAAAVSLYQASQDIYDVFDKVIVLYEGRQIYFGPCTAARQFFIEMGFECPARQTTADFLTSLTNPAERTPRPGFEGRVPRTPDEFAQRWQESAARQALLYNIEDFDNQFSGEEKEYERFLAHRKLQQARGMKETSPYTISTLMQIRLCLRRALQRLRNDLSLFFTQVVGNFIVALIISSIFFNLRDDTSSFFSRGSLLFFAILSNAFQSALEILQLYEQRPIVEKHKRMAFYRPSSEAIASWITDLPAKVITSISFNLVLYFMCNLRRTPGAFFVFLLFSFVCTLVMSMIFRTIGACTKSQPQAMAPAAIIIIALIVYTGFVIPTPKMLGWSRWINYIDPIAYAFESLMVNEFDGREFACSQFLPAGPGYSPPANAICSSIGAVAGSPVVQGTDYINLSFQYYRSHEWRNLGIMFGFMIFFGSTYLLAVETIAQAKSKGEVLVFRRGYTPKEFTQKKEDAEDIEAGKPMGRTEEDVDALKKSDQAVGVIKRQTAVFHWEDVTYDVKIKGADRRILDRVDGWVQPGTLTALMGASGAGKTTLLDTLASRVTMGVVGGQMLVDGHARDESFQRKTGYVQQQDLHLQTSTVREALLFSARLRQPADVSDAEKKAYVQEVISLLEMEKYADAVVGVPGEGLNVEQRKRLTIGVELVAKPDLLLFLDEPTSGLDSQTAWSICTLLRKLANHGQAILCTIHQPSSLLFQSFDRLLFLQRGGRTAYFGDIGENSRTLIDYFEAQGADPCPADANPAEWMLSVIGAAPGAVAKRDYADAWRESKEYARVKDHLAWLRANPKDVNPSGDVKAHREFAAPFYLQFWYVTHRVFQQIYRTPSYIYSKFALVIASGLFIGFTFFRVGRTLEDLQDQMFSIFMLFVLTNSLSSQAMPHFCTQRDLYEVRERPSKAYSWKAFMLANILVELPWNTMAAIFLFFCWYFPIGLFRNAEFTHATTERAGLMFLFVWQFLLFLSTYTHMIIAGVGDAITGGNISNLLFTLCLLFCGVLAAPSGPNAFPHFWIFMYRVSPFTYLVEGMLSVALASAPVTCSATELAIFDPPSGQTCEQYLQPYISATGGLLSNPNATSACSVCPETNTNQFLAGVFADYNNRWRDFGLLWVYIVFNACAALFFYWLARVPKGSRVKKE
ncbi:ABC-2 type transporter-domain-containing protein [Vararia minispora EC-137]|uniref:ABC-2 type transporter-domain-containing protein n=1 Tax=Vararia minispora EC-137 TaxID=1314806 RepID=A0ACB8QEA5_9AGAM|nr:ABC-2 type transporter-domain-containing protein [Vararia minispora EC-137]